MKNPKVQLSYSARILEVKFADNVVIDVDDIKDIYEYGNEKAGAEPYCIMFESAGHYDLTEDAVQYMVDNPENKHILAKVYVVNSNESKTKVKFHLLFDKPKLVPFTFKTAEEDRKYLAAVIKAAVR